MSGRDDTERVPVTVLTGFLGAGKTTLLNRILRERHGLRIAVIENELGEQGVDAGILLREEAEDIVQMDNGCLCCSVRGDLRRALETLAGQRAEGRLAFDCVVIETSGAADPGPVAQTLFLEPTVARDYKLAGIVAVVDAIHGPGTLRIRPEARAQVAYADRIVLAKSAQATDPALNELRDALAALNPHAPVADGDEPALVHDLVAQVQQGTQISRIEQIAPDGLDTPQHGSEIRSVSLSTDRPFDGPLLEQFLAAAIEICGTDLYRCKGLLSVAGNDHQVVLQGVQLSMSTRLGVRWPDDAVRKSRIVLIGHDLPVAPLKDSLRRCLVDDGPDAVTTERPPAYRSVGALGAGWLA
ncbi:MAG: GTP-binding protein [Burkholderiaceae bacterium]|nr:GTP-binding protein [Burkholderiaceae bacterium]